jgi:hypothetical protein
VDDGKNEGTKKRMQGKLFNAGRAVEGNVDQNMEFMQWPGHPGWPAGFVANV